MLAEDLEVELAGIKARGAFHRLDRVTVAGYEVHGLRAALGELQLVVDGDLKAAAPEPDYLEPECDELHLDDAETSTLVHTLAFRTAGSGEALGPGWAKSAMATRLARSGIGDDVRRAVESLTEEELLQWLAYRVLARLHATAETAAFRRFLERVTGVRLEWRRGEWVNAAPRGAARVTVPTGKYL